MKKSFVGFSIGVAAACVLLIVVLATGLWKRFFYPNNDGQIRTMIVTPREAGSSSGSGRTELMLWGENFNTKIPMEDGEIVITVITRESEDGAAEDQIAAYRRAADVSGPIYITYISYDEKARGYKRIWSAPTAAARPETITMLTQDIIGDRNNCIVVTGMNNRNEHTMTIFRNNPASDQPFKKIAELQTDGSIIIQETGRSLAYQQGITSGHSFNIAAYGHDSSSNNILDQFETIFAFNPQTGQYERANVSKIPGSQIEQRRLRELLSGAPGVFENFINDLWYYVSPQGTIDARQYIYFNPSGREIIFFGDETQQVFLWQNSTPTRYGLYVTSQNISITSLRRFIDIQLESLDSIRLRVIEDVRLKITVTESWDGSYRRAAAVNLEESGPSIKPAFNALYDSSLGRFQFQNTGEYTISSGGALKKGHYVFFKVNEHDLLELRPEEGTQSAESRTVYRIDTSGAVLSLSRVRLGTVGIQDMLETPITLTPVN
jgi:hypothetical protein